MPIAPSWKCVELSGNSAILKIKITTGAFGERRGLEMMWENIFGMIVADAGYLGKDLQEKARDLNKHLFTAVKANMKKLMTDLEWQILKMRQCAKTVFFCMDL